MSDPREAALVEGLRLQAVLSMEHDNESHFVTLATMAADRIDALEAEVERQADIRKALVRDNRDKTDEARRLMKRIPDPDALEDAVETVGAYVEELEAKVERLTRVRDAARAVLNAANSATREAALQRLRAALQEA